MMPVRLRDFIEDDDSWIYAVSTYDNDEKVGCVLRYVPDEKVNEYILLAYDTKNLTLKMRMLSSHTINHTIQISCSESRSRI
jgi:predicted nucleotidyltransferase